MIYWERKLPTLRQIFWRSEGHKKLELKDMKFRITLKAWLRQLGMLPLCGGWWATKSIQLFVGSLFKWGNKFIWLNILEQMASVVKLVLH